MKMSIHVSLGLALSLLVGSFATVSAGPYDEELKRYDYQVEINTIYAIQQELTPREYAAEIGWEFPVPPPRLAPGDITVLVEQEVERLVEEKYPRSRFEEIENQAQQIYRLYEVGDTITVRARRRGNEFRAVTGRLLMKNFEYIKIGDQVINLIDLDKRDLAHFDRERREEAIDFYVRVNLRRFREERNEYELKQREEVGKIIREKNGYYFLPRASQWMPKKRVFDIMYKKEWEKRYETMRPRQQESVLLAAGWTRDDMGNWMPPADLADQIVVVDTLPEPAAATGGNTTQPGPEPATAASPLETTMEVAQSTLRDIVAELRAEGKIAPVGAGEGGNDTSMDGDEATEGDDQAAVVPRASDEAVAELYDED